MCQWLDRLSGSLRKALALQVLRHLEPFKKASDCLQMDDARLDTALAALLELRASIAGIPEQEARELLLKGLEVNNLVVDVAVP